MKAFLALIALSAALPAFASETNVGGHCPEYYAAAQGSNGVAGDWEGFSPAEARQHALQSCAFHGGTNCRIVKTEFHQKLNVWGACIDAGSGVFNGIRH